MHPHEHAYIDILIVHITSARILPKKTLRITHIHTLTHVRMHIHKGRHMPFTKTKTHTSDRLTNIAYHVLTAYRHIY